MRVKTQNNTHKYLYHSLDPIKIGFWSMARAMLPIEIERITAQINKLLFQVEAIEKEGDCL